MAQASQPGPARQGRWQRFRVTYPFSPGALAGLVGALVGVLAVALLLGAVLHIRGGIVLVVAMPFIVAWHEGRRTAFQFDALKVRVGNVNLPWHMVTQFVVGTSADGQSALLGVRLSDGAKLPEGAEVPPADPAIPAPLYVAVQRSKFDLDKMIGKARKYAPRHVQIVVAEPSGERVAA